MFANIKSKPMEILMIGIFAVGYLSIDLDNNLHVDKEKINFLALIAALISVLAVFLPWLEASSSASIGEYSANYSSGGISGISLGGGLFGLVVALTGGIMAFKHIKWSFAAGVINFTIGLGYILGWLNAGGDVSYSSGYGGASASASITPQIGIYIFVLSSLLFSIFTLKNLKQEIAK
jgi:hypothetical protein